MDTCFGSILFLDTPYASPVGGIDGSVVRIIFSGIKVFVCKVFEGGLFGYLDDWGKSHVSLWYKDKIDGDESSVRGMVMASI